MGSSSYSFQLSMRIWSSGLTKLIKCMPSVGRGTTCVVWAGSRLMVTLGWPKWTKPWSIKSWMACLKALKWLVLCLDPWWYAQWRSILNYGRIAWGNDLRARVVNNPTSMSFRRAWLNDIPNCENRLGVLKEKRVETCRALGLGYEARVSL